MERYKLTMEYEAPESRQAITLAENAMDQLPVLDHTLEVKAEGDEDWTTLESGGE